MKSCKKEKINKRVKNIKRAAYIKYKLYSAGLNLSDIATELNITNAAVYRSIYGLSKITRIDEWLKKNIGIV